MSHHLTVEVPLPAGQRLSIIAVERAGRIDLAAYKASGHLIIIEDSDHDSGDLAMAFHCLRLALGDRGLLTLAPAGHPPAMVASLVMPCELAVRLAAAGDTVTVVAVGRVSLALVSACVLVVAGLRPPAAIQAVERQLPDAEFDIETEVAVSVFEATHLQRIGAPPEVLS